MKQDDNFESDVMLFVFFFVAITFVGLSGYQTYKGYEPAFGFGAFPFAIAVSLLLLFLNLALRKNHLEGSSISGICILLLIVISVSFCGNFNAIYSNWTGSEVRKSSIDSARIVYVSNLNKAKYAIEQSNHLSEYNDFISKITSAKSNIRAHITDKAARGYGKNAKLEVQKAENVLGGIRISPPTAPKGSSRSAAFWNDFADGIIGQIEEIEKTVVKSKYSDVNIVSDIERLISNATNIETVSSLKNESENIREKVSLLTGNSNLKFNDFNIDAGKTGKISDTFETAFSPENRDIKTYIITVLSLLLDLFLPIVTLVFYKKNNNMNIISNSPTSRNNNKSNRLTNLKDAR